MLRALIKRIASHDGREPQATTLCASTVGTFCPSVEAGSRVRPGMILGRIRRLGRWHDLLAPNGVDGFLERLLPAWAPVEYGSPLFRLRDAPQGALPPEEPEGLRERAKGRLRAVRAQFEGTLHRRPMPGTHPFAPEGSRVSAQDIIAVVEVMKTFTPIRAPFSGTIRRWLAADGEGVEPGADLVLVEPELSPSEEPVVRAIGSEGA